MSVSLSAVTFPCFPRSFNTFVVSEYYSLSINLLKASLLAFSPPVSIAELPKEVKSYGHSITVEENITDKQAAYNLLLSLTDASVSRMRADKVKAHCVCVNIRDNHFNNKSHQKQFSVPTDITYNIYNTVKELFDEVWNGKTPLRLLGVTLTDITKDGNEQLSLFGENDAQNDKKQKIDSVVDAIRNKYGSATIMPGSIMNTKRPTLL